MQLINRLSNLYHRLITAVFYRPLFRAIGSGTTVRKPILISNPQFISIGNGVFIRDGVRLEVVGPRDGITPVLSIGDNTNIEQNVHIVCGSRIQIGSNVTITGNCSIVDVTHPYQDVEDPVKIGERISTAPSYVEIGDGSFIGMGSVILPNVCIGSKVVVGANSVVTQDIPDCCVAAGAPARIIKKYDKQKKTWERVS